MSDVSERFKKFNEDFQETCAKLNRNPNDICIVAVSKLQDISKIHEAYRIGHLDFGENYIQEAVEKIRTLQLAKARWHLIGPIQTNKINKLIGQFHLVHSLNTLELARELSDRCVKKSHKQKVFCQVNFAGEKTKSGFSKEELLRSWSELKNLEGLEIQGIMTMPPLENPEPSFVEAQTLAQHLELPFLSMGTTTDWKLGLKYGSTHIRIGTALFGERK